MPLNSNSLFHFTRGGLEVLKLILTSGFRPSYSKEFDMSQANSNSQSIYYNTYSGYPIYRVLRIPMVCFCDIPLSAVHSHVEKYSDKCQHTLKPVVYGIGLNKDWAINKDVHPISYYVSSGKLSTALGEICRSHNEKRIVIGSTSDSSPNYMSPVEMGEGYMIQDNKGFYYPLQTLYTKPLKQSSFYANENYQEEKEWRYIPSNARIISQHCLSGGKGSINGYYYKKEEDNAERAVKEVNNNYPYDHLSFNIDDITHIVINEENEIPVFLESLSQIYSEVEDRKLHTLFSKVTSYERILNDFSIF